MKSHRGFTLVEVMIALAIVAFALISGLTMLSQFTMNLGAVQERTWANWAAMDHLIALQIDEQWSKAGETRGSEKQTPYGFSWHRTINETPYDRVRRIEVEMLRNSDREVVHHLSCYMGKESAW